MTEQRRQGKIGMQARKEACPFPWPGVRYWASAGAGFVRRLPYSTPYGLPMGRTRVLADENVEKIA
jgi:hypothetical protein